ncbi:GspH/FimT family pseudopilin [Alkanindiges sp. WGS2144]|uniref:GspH/FimT family pseudopilin n=1 Tax=Alkanindiges sp. WGS2144 TaxID=3366808 RepID=UPI0037523521
MDRRLGNRGFTLVELMVTIAVVAILAMIAAPSMSNMVAKQRLNSTTRDLVSTLSTARSQAALLRKEVTVTLNSDSPNTQTNYYWNPTINSNLTSSTTSVVFNPNGTVKDATGDTDFVICNSKTSTTKTISLTRTGAQYFKAEGTCT